jgi:hypothetical protein
MIDDATTEQDKEPTVSYAYRVCFELTDVPQQTVQLHQAVVALNKNT